MQFIFAIYLIYCEKNISMRIMPYGYRKRGNIIKSNGFNKKNKDSPSSTSVGRGGII
jgi:hypothetical protein